MNQLEKYLDHLKFELDENENALHVCAWGQYFGRTAETESELELYDHLVQTSKDERQLQTYLQQRPWLMIGELGGAGQCRWVLAQPRLGSQYVPDFLVARLDSTGVKWTLIELQSPAKQPFTKTGNLSKHLNEGYRQIEEWRAWLTNNLDYARKPQYENGLGLTGISPQAEGLVLIGKREERTPEVAERLRPFMWANHLAVHTYDWITREARDWRGHRALWDDNEDCKCY